MFADLQEFSKKFIQIKYKRYRWDFIRVKPFKHRFMIILGEQGVGKTTTLLQYLVDAAQNDLASDAILYIQADHFLMDGMSLYRVAEQFDARGGKAIAIDEIHN
jgi:predicted AAA+ superfamily ATPase